MLALFIIILVVAADQITKYWALTLLAPIRSYPFIDGILEFHFVRNRGAAWGMLADSRWIFMTVSAVAIILMLVCLFCSKESGRLFRISLAMIIGGGIGNMIDRLFYTDGAVVDFIYFKLIDFPVFNVADCAVTVGAVLLVLWLITDIISQEKSKKSKDSADGKTDNMQ